MRKVIREQFGLKYRKVSGADIRYHDEQFDEKRQWISRLLAQLLADDVVIVSIDESSFQHSLAPSLAW